MHCPPRVTTAAAGGVDVAPPECHPPRLLVDMQHEDAGELLDGRGCVVDRAALRSAKQREVSLSSGLNQTTLPASSRIIGPAWATLSLGAMKMRPGDPRG